MEINDLKKMTSKHMRSLQTIFDEMTDKQKGRNKIIVTLPSMTWSYTLSSAVITISNFSSNSS